MNQLSESEKKLLGKIKQLGSANLPLDEREKVCFPSVIPKSHHNFVILFGSSEFDVKHV